MRAFWAGAFAVAMLASTVSIGRANDAEPQWRYSSSLLGEPKYPADFKHYDYVNPDAPKGGTLNMVAVGTFDSLNPFVVQGVAAAGLSDFGGGLLYDTLMTDSLDQGSTQYPLIAEALQYPDDFSRVKFKLNPKAKWHDGQPITVDDVIWSFDVLKRQSPMYNKYYGDVEKAEKTGEREVKFTFSQKGNRELPQILGQLAVLPKHWWEGKDAQGKQRDITRATLEIPLGSSAYKIDSMTPGRSITGRASMTIGARIWASMSGAIISTACATSTISTRMQPGKPSRRADSTIIATRIVPSAGLNSIISQPYSAAMS